jgi:hypothetical protein
MPTPTSARLSLIAATPLRSLARVFFQGVIGDAIERIIVFFP